jgi:surface carbohydrate biosynthesis protein
MKNICVFLPLEVYSREFDSKLLLAAKLSEHGYKVIMADHIHIRYMTYFFSRGVYVGKNMHLYPPPYKKVIKRILGREIFNTWYFDLLKRRSYSTIYLEEEGGYFSTDSSVLDDGLRDAFCTEIMHKDDYVATWGRTQASFYRNTAFHNDNVINTGHPRFNLYNRKFRDFYKSDSDRLKKLYGNFILVNTNYSFANHQKGLKGNFSKSSVYDPDNQDLMLSFSVRWAEQLERYSAMINLIFVIACKFPEKTFVVRPHPGESEETYVYIFKDLQNVVVSKEDSVGGWLYGCECLIHDGCTTGLEAALLEKEIINYNPVALKSNNNELLSSFGPKAINSDEVVRLLEGMFACRSSTPTYDDALESVASVLQNAKPDADRSSLDKIVTILDGMDPKKIKNSLLKYNAILYLTFIPYVISELLKDTVSLLVNRAPVRYRYKKETSYGLNKINFQRKVASVQSVTNSRVNAKHISNHCFVFEPQEHRLEK